MVVVGVDGDAAALKRSDVEYITTTNNFVVFLYFLHVN